MALQTHYNRRPLPWVKGGALLLVATLFFLLNGRSVVVRGASYVSSFFRAADTAFSQEMVALRARIKDLESENERLQRLFNMGSRNTIPADIRLGGDHLFVDTLIIDRGVADGITVGDHVSTDDGIYVGTILETGDRWSKIVPFTQLGRKTIVRAGQNKEITFEITGIGAGEAEARLPIAVAINTGDILWDGSDPSIIAGLADRMERPAASQIQTLYIRPPVSFGALSHVLVHKLGEPQ